MALACASINTLLPQPATHAPDKQDHVHHSIALHHQSQVVLALVLRCMYAGDKSNRLRHMLMAI